VIQLRGAPQTPTHWAKPFRVFALFDCDFRLRAAHGVLLAHKNAEDSLAGKNPTREPAGLLDD
jgi:hypothetical protein